MNLLLEKFSYKSITNMFLVHKSMAVASDKGHEIGLLNIRPDLPYFLTCTKATFL